MARFRPGALMVGENSGMWHGCFMTIQPEFEQQPCITDSTEFVLDQAADELRVMLCGELKALVDEGQAPAVTVGVKAIEQQGQILISEATNIPGFHVYTSPSRQQDLIMSTEGLFLYERIETVRSLDKTIGAKLPFAPTARANRDYWLIHAGSIAEKLSAARQP